MLLCEHDMLGSFLNILDALYQLDNHATIANQCNIATRPLPSVEIDPNCLVLVDATLRSQPHAEVNDSRDAKTGHASVGQQDRYEAIPAHLV